MARSRKTSARVARTASKVMRGNYSKPAARRGLRALAARASPREALGGVRSACHAGDGRGAVARGLGRASPRSPVRAVRRTDVFAAFYREFSRRRASEGNLDRHLLPRCSTRRN
jgi:hypothetical protein